jgi:hypothetical protein
MGGGSLFTNTTVQIELNKKREAELNVNWKNPTLVMKEVLLQCDPNITITCLNKLKVKADKDKAGIECDLHETRWLDELARALIDSDPTREKNQVENQDLSRQIVDVESAIATLFRNKISLTTQFEDSKRLTDAESRDRASLLSTYKALSSNICTLKQRIEKEAENKNDILRSLSTAHSDILLWK